MRQNKFIGLPGEKPMEKLRRWRKTLPEYRLSDIEQLKGETARLASQRHLAIKIEIPFKVLEYLNQEFEVGSKFEMDRALMQMFERLAKDKKMLATLIEKY